MAKRTEPETEVMAEPEAEAERVRITFEVPSEIECVVDHRSASPLRYTIRPADLPEVSLETVFVHGLRRKVNDSTTAASEGGRSKRELADEMVRKLREGDFERRRSTGSRLESMIRRLAAEMIRAEFKARTKAGKAKLAFVVDRFAERDHEGDHAAAWESMVDAVVRKHGERLAAEAAEAIRREDEERKRREALAAETPLSALFD